MVTLGLDQMLHCWTVQTRKSGHKSTEAELSSHAGQELPVITPGQVDNALVNDDDEASAANIVLQNKFDISWLSSNVVQVLEPAALDVCETHRAQLHVLVTGRGTQLLKFE